MYIQRNKSKGKNGKIYSSTLLCSKYREEGKIKTKVMTNLSHLPAELILSIENLLKHGKGALVSSNDIIVKRSVDFGLAYLLIHIMNNLHISKVLDKILPEQASLLKSIIIGKIITRGSKLGIYNWLKRNEEVCLKLGIDIKNKKVDALYSSLADASCSQKKIEHKWFLYNKSKHKEIYLYDITSTYFEGTKNELSEFGYNRDNKKGKKQINIGLITNSEGFPLKIEVFKGNINDHKTVLGQIKSIKKEFDTTQIVFVGDRGMKIRYNLEELEETEKEGINYITGITREEIESLMKTKILQLELFKHDLAEVEYERSRYILSVNPILQEKEIHHLKTIRSITEEELSEVKASWEKRNRKNKETIERLKNGDKNKKLVTHFKEKDIDKYKLRVEIILLKRGLKKYYEIKEISNNSFIIDFKAEKYQQSKNLAGKYVVCTNIKKEEMDKYKVREQYKNLQNVEHAFRDLKSENIQIRPVYHRNELQTRGHVLASMFCYAIIKEMETKIYPFLKIWNKKTKNQLSFNDIIEELKDIKLCTLDLGKNVKQIKITEPNEIQEQILKLFKMKKNDIEKTM